MSYRGTPRLWYTFSPAFITLGTKTVAKINYHVPIKSAAKLKKHKAEIVNTNIFLNKSLDRQ